MAGLNKYPLIYELNTRVWLRELSTKAGRALTLAEVPEVEFQKWQNWGVRVLWLMGIWEESPKARMMARTHSELWRAYQRALPDVGERDIVASPYAIARYSVSTDLGGEAALAKFRHRLSEHGIRLMLDFVPNHLALDCEWIETHPEFFISVPAHIAEKMPDDFVEHGGLYYACGKDPYFPAWTDTLQLNYANPAVHEAMCRVLRKVANLCDGVRCSMAMLVLKDTFNHTWGHFGLEMKEEFWQKAICAVKENFPHFLFVAEAYWDTEWALQQQGFDFVYDKRLYDRIRSRDIEGIKAHLRGAVRYQQKLIRFIENHNEERAAQAFGANHRAAALLTYTAIGAHLLHEGEHDGLRTRLPVQLIRRPNEEVDFSTVDFYHRLMRLCQNASITNGDFHVLSGYSDAGIIAFERQSGGHTGHTLTFVNLTAEPCESYFPTIALNHIQDYEHIEVFVTDPRKSPQFELWQGGVSVRLRPHEGLVFVVR
ncbi:MAG: alpha-amylase family glycosyl hydrolase [Chloroherpetonaceae bacterium]|nr:alpha-amylase family glycosyl hydrolase [Chloroherpetonaceae bacterium]MDW8466782.1 alpha-amylase family glycosyl hydrolase [Chloroherpetonaceae bacterium]